MAGELRSPHERRSDQLSILTRRAPPPPSPGRFSKTLTDAACVGAFDPAFDSDADTDGPTSGSSVWKRDFSRVLSASSGMASVDGVDGSVVVADVDAVVADHRHLDDTPNSPLVKDHRRHKVNHLVQKTDVVTNLDIPPQPAPTPTTTVVVASTTPAPLNDLQSSSTVAAAAATVTATVPPNLTPKPTSSFDGDRTLSDEQTPPPGTFSRERACSFYGRGSKEVDISAPPTAEANATDRLGPVSRAQLRAVLDDDYDLFFDSAKGKDVKDLCSEEGSPAKSDSTAPDSPEMKEKDEEDGSESGKKGIGRKVRSFKLYASEERLTVSLVSGSEESSRSGVEDELEITGTEMNDLLAGALERPRLSSGTVPLFVEEAGRIPRAAIVDGKMQRVKVKKNKRLRNKERREKSRWYVERAFGGCLAKSFEEDVKRRRKRRKRRRRRKSTRKMEKLW